MIRDFQRYPRLRIATKGNYGNQVDFQGDFSGDFFASAFWCMNSSRFLSDQQRTVFLYSESTIRLHHTAAGYSTNATPCTEKLKRN